MSRSEVMSSRLRRSKRPLRTTLPKVVVAGSNPVVRSSQKKSWWEWVRPEAGDWRAARRAQFVPKAFRRAPSRAQSRSCVPLPLSAPLSGAVWLPPGGGEQVCLATGPRDALNGDAYEPGPR